MREEKECEKIRSASRGGVRVEKGRVEVCEKRRNVRGDSGGKRVEKKRVEKKCE